MLELAPDLVGMLTLGLSDPPAVAEAGASVQTGIGAIVVALVTLTALEVVLGIDNVVVLAVLAGKLPEKERPKAMRTGLAMAMLMRIVLLFAITWVMQLDAHKLFTALGHEFSAKDLVLVIGGTFLLGKATWEIHHHVEGPSHEEFAKASKRRSFWGVIVQVMLMDAVFSIDSVITAVGMTEGMGNETARLWVMISAVVIAVGVMMVFATAIARFIDKHPTVKVLALAFLVLIGLLLVVDGVGHHVPRGYVYSAMGFSLFVEMINMWARANRKKRLEAKAAAG